MILGSEYIGMTFRITTVVAPVAVYFLILGLLNTRRRPQLLTGRTDFFLLVVALSPLLMIPAVGVLGLSTLGTLLAAAAVGAVVYFLAPRGRTWVIYNLPPRRARQAVLAALRRIGMDADEQGGRIRLPAGGSLELGGFALLRNVSIRMDRADAGVSREFEAALARELGGVDVEPSPAAVALLLVATAMLVAPMALVAHEAPEIVRFLGDLLQ